MSARTIRLSDNSSWRLSLGLQFCHPTNYRKVDEDQMALLKNGLGWWSFNSERNFQALCWESTCYTGTHLRLIYLCLKRRRNAWREKKAPQSTNMGEKTKSVREGRSQSSSCCFLDVNSRTFCPHSFLLEGERRSNWGIKISPCIISVSFCASEWQTSKMSQILGRWPIFLFSYKFLLIFPNLALLESCFLNFIFIFVCGPIQEVVAK